MPASAEYVDAIRRSVFEKYFFGKIVDCLRRKFAEEIRTGAAVEPDFDNAVRRHRTLDTIVRASQTGERQKILLSA